MGKKTKFALGVALVVVILIIAFVGAYFISMDNIIKNTPTKPTFSDETLVYEYDSGGDSPTTSTLTVDLGSGKVHMTFLAATIYGGEYETVFSVVDGQVVVGTAYGVDAVDGTGFSAIVGLPSTLTSNVSYVFTPADGGQNLKVLFDGGDGDDTVLLDMVIPQADIDNMIAAGGVDPSQLPEAPDPTDPQPTDPQPTDPQPTDPQPTDPQPTDPEPTDPPIPEGALTYEYSSGGETPTTSTLVVDPATGKVSFNFLASTMYQGSCETTYTYEGGVLAISIVEDVDANDISGFAAIIGLPATMTSDVFFAAEAADGGMKLSVWFDGGDDDDVLLFEMVIPKTDMDKLA